MDNMDLLTGLNVLSTMQKDNLAIAEMYPVFINGTLIDNIYSCRAIGKRILFSATLSGEIANAYHKFITASNVFISTHKELLEKTLAERGDI